MSKIQDPNAKIIRELRDEVESLRMQINQRAYRWPKSKEGGDSLLSGALKMALDWHCLMCQNVDVRQFRKRCLMVDIHIKDVQETWHCLQCTNSSIVGSILHIDHDDKLLQDQAFPVGP